jgi:hemolysin III
MKQKEPEAFNKYPKAEEISNAVTHGIGAVLSVAALIAMINKSLELNSLSYLITSLVFGISMVFLYTASTLYHSIQKPSVRNKLNVMDHMAIYLLIAGTYTPFTVNVLGGTLGLVIFIIVWAFGLTGIVLKIFFFGKYNTLSAIAYVVMGWIIVIAIGPLIDRLGLPGTMWLFGGGIFYTLGAVLYLIHKLPFNHAIFHLFVLAGTFCHFISVYYYVLK